MSAIHLSQGCHGVIKNIKSNMHKVLKFISFEDEKLNIISYLLTSDI